MKSKFFFIFSLVACFLLHRFSHRFDSYVLIVATNIGINVILGVSLNLINGFTGQFSLGHAGFMAIGAYTSAALSMNYGSLSKTFAMLGPVAAGNLTYLIFLLIGGLAAATAGFLVGLPSLRLKGDYLAIVTLGFGEIIRVIVINTPQLGGALGLTNIPASNNIFWTISFACLTVYVVGTLVNSTYGRGYIAVHDDEIAAEAMGINPTKYKISAFVIGAFFGGVAGGLFAHTTQNINAGAFDFMKSIELVVIVILGGMGKNLGVIIAAAMLTLLPEYLRAFSQYRNIIYSAMLILLMLLCPGGLAHVWTSLQTRVWKLLKR